MLKEMYCLFVIAMASISQISIVDGETTAKCIANGKRMMQMKTRMASAKPGKLLRTRWKGSEPKMSAFSLI